MPVIVCYGDSNTHGYNAATNGRFPPDVRWPGVLAASLGAGWQVIEEGLNGRTTIRDDPYMPGRDGRAHLVPCLQSHAPIDLVILMLGTNDTKVTFGAPATEIAQGAGALANVARLSGTGPDGGAPEVLLVAPPVLGEPTDRSTLWGFGEARAKSRQFAALYGLVAELGGYRFLDADPAAEVDPIDGVHLTSAGHRSLGLAVADAVRSMGLG